MGAEGLREALGMMDSDDPETRRLAVLALSATGLPAAVQPMLRAVGDSDWRVRKAAVEELLKAGGAEVFEGLYRHLFSGDNAGARNSAAEALTRLGAPAASALGERLGESDPDVRKAIVDIIGAIGIRESAGALIRALDDEDPNVRASAAEHLGRMKATEALDRLVSYLKSDDQWTAFNAAVSLGEMGDGRAVQPLLEAARDPFLREAALDALGRISDPAAWTVFVEALGDRVPVIREAAVKGLAAIHRAASKAVPGDTLKTGAGRDAAEFLTASLGSEDVSLVKSSTYLLGVMREADAAGAVARLLSGDGTRGEALYALGEIAKGGLGPIAPLLADKESVVRASAALVLGDTGDKGAVDMLIPLLGDEDGHTRRESATALGKLGDRRAVEPLLALLRDDYDDVQEAAVRALGRLSGPELSSRVRGMASDDDPAFRRNVAALIGLLDGPEAAHALSRLMKDEEAEVRMTAVEALGGTEAGEAVKALPAALTDEDPRVRLAAAGVLARLGTEDAAGPLTLLLGDADPWVRIAAVRGLAEAVGRPAVQDILPLLTDPYVPVRITVVEAIGRLGGPGSREILQSVVESPGEEEVKDAARGFLGG